MRASSLTLAGLAGLLALGAASVAAAEDAPMRKAGLWETSMALSGAQAHNMTMRMCTDPTVERRRSIFTGPNQHSACSVQEYHRTATGMSFHSVCQNANGLTNITDGTATGDFNSHYHLDVKTHITGAASPPGGADRHMTMDAKYLGACPAGQSPGDMSFVTADGRVMPMGGMGMGGPH